MSRGERKRFIGRARGGGERTVDGSLSKGMGKSS